MTPAQLDLLIGAENRLTAPQGAEFGAPGDDAGVDLIALAKRGR